LSNIVRGPVARAVAGGSVVAIAPARLPGRPGSLKPPPLPYPDRVTPAIRAAELARIAFEVLRYEHDSRTRAYGPEAAARLSLPPGAVFKTLVAKAAGPGLVVALVPVDRELDLKALAAAVGSKRAEMAGAVEAERATGYVVGGISPLGQRRALPTVIDRSALALPRLFVSAGRRGLEIALRPTDLIALCHATTAAIARV
jgi:Cys-tRNA(Pro)/Cys-tRNA(Cys) deacylase